MRHITTCYCGDCVSRSHHSNVVFALVLTIVAFGLVCFYGGLHIGRAEKTLDVTKVHYDACADKQKGYFIVAEDYQQPEYRWVRC